MIWTKLGILLIGFTSAGALPYTVGKALAHVKFDINTQTLSFLSNKNIYGERYKKGYKWLLFSTALFTYLFFWLLTRYYDLGEHERLMGYINLSFVSLALLAFMPHNIEPYSLKSLAPTLQRFLHNVLAVIVFLTLPALIITFQVIILQDFIFLGISGLIIIAINLLSVLLAIFKKRLEWNS
ncbi:MAG: hypothetical protein PHT26_05390 [Lentimicrobiaceae bacterium]|nr:hypothetical protein [Lentimicrobiaceae bacterium]